MPTEELQAEAATQGSDSGILCEATEDGAPCEHKARYWLEIITTAKVVAVCAYHVEDWKRYAAMRRLDPSQWSIYPMR
jgi:hypothetical protein